ncbi:NAD-dependent epimerase/dehydratase family protein [Candidatus Pelagibacter sp.]|nr:NAD-dependent epimerase/dehydratase family protein [Candidatus Pelagibacter sp.]
MKDIIVITGGAGFIGSHVVDLFIKKTKYKIVSIDNYSSGSRKNHIQNKRVKYIKGDTRNLSKLLKGVKNKIHSLFHFGEFSRIYQSFINMDQCIKSNTIGSNEVFNFCMNNKIKLIYSATSASLGNKGYDKDLSPYAFSKAKNLEFLNNLKKWFDFKYEVIYFYNVYGPRQICEGEMATVIGIFENSYKKNKFLPVVKPGSQRRNFTHVKDTVEACYKAWKMSKNRHYSVYNKKSYSILEVSKLFGVPIKLMPKRSGERYSSALTKINLSNKVHIFEAKIDLKKYIEKVIKSIL